MSQTALCQFDLEAVLSLRLRAAQRRLRRLTKDRFGCCFTTQLCLGFMRSPRFCSHAAKGDAGTRDSAAGDSEYNCGRRQREFVRGAITKLQIVLLTSDDRWWQRDVCDQIARLQNSFT